MLPRSPASSGEHATRVLLASTDADLRRWVQGALPSEAIVCAFADRASGIAELAARSRADVCLLDLRLPGGGLAATRVLTAGSPAVRVVAWAASDEDPGLLDALHTGAAGCIVGTPGRDALAPVLADVVAGRPALPRAVVTRMVARLRPA